jgi:hypothetical protein
LYGKIVHAKRCSFPLNNPFFRSILGDATFRAVAAVTVVQLATLPMRLLATAATTSLQRRHFEWRQHYNSPCGGCGTKGGRAAGPAALRRQRRFS